MDSTLVVSTVSFPDLSEDQLVLSTILDDLSVFVESVEEVLAGHVREAGHCDRGARLHLRFAVGGFKGCCQFGMSF